MHHIKNTKNDERGFASITIALVIVLVLSLITVGFAQLARREQQSALNKQLASQAQYAAESGINDVVKKIESPGATPIPDNPENCITPNVITGEPDGNIIGDDSRDVSYTCALADLSPNSLQKDLDADSSWYTTFSTDQPLANLKISWKNKADYARVPKNAGSKAFAPSGNGTGGWGSSPAVLQVNITPLNGSMTRDNLINRSFTVYLYPSKSGGATPNSISYSAGANHGVILSGNCTDTAQDCSATIQNLNSVGGTGPYLLHIVDYYDPSIISVTGTPAVGTTPVQFDNAQAKIDVTGKARNVLKRLQVRVPLSPAVPLPSYAIEAQNICKRIQTEPDGTKYIVKNDPEAVAIPGNPCFLND